MYYRFDTCIRADEPEPQPSDSTGGAAGFSCTWHHAPPRRGDRRTHNRARSSTTRTRTTSPTDNLLARPSQAEFATRRRLHRPPNLTSWRHATCCHGPVDTTTRWRRTRHADPIAPRRGYTKRSIGRGPRIVPPRPEHDRVGSVLSATCYTQRCHAWHLVRLHERDGLSPTGRFTRARCLPLDPAIDAAARPRSARLPVR